MTLRQRMGTLRVKFAFGPQKKALWRRIKAKSRLGRAPAASSAAAQAHKAGTKPGTVPVQNVSTGGALVKRPTYAVSVPPLPQPVSVGRNHIGASLAMALFVGGSGVLAVLPEMPGVKAILDGHMSGAHAARDTGLVTASLGSGE